ncbi:glycerol-3-phosphate dehydrogenase/oxidase [Capilliphycus salinus ALCB114379]|uniref:glycerol-3-phosphate dehydrogenase/oxidase n=1 Tax=Capilliphycus salinus TaxID=2768948 RepID=UPI0039A5AA90
MLPLSVALKLNDLISFDRNRLSDSQKHLPQGRVISKAECEKLIPGLTIDGLTGAAVFYDAQMYNSERLTLAFLHSAVEAGANISNYTKVTGFLQDKNRITGVKVTDVFTGNCFEIQAKTVINTSGPWVNSVLGLVQPQPDVHQMGLAQAMNVITRPLFKDYAVGLPGKGRFWFVSPWRGKSMIGTWQGVEAQHPDEFQISEASIQGFINEINEAYPPAKLTREDVLFVHQGQLPYKGIDPKTGEPKMLKQYQIRDFAQEGLPGLISVVGVKYTTARDVAQKTIDQVFKSWGQTSPPSVSAKTPLYGGEIADFSAFLRREITTKQSEGFPEETIRSLVYNYGSVYEDVLGYLKKFPQPSSSDDAVLKAQVLYAVDCEMAQTLSDVVFRRTELGSAGELEQSSVQLCAETMANLLNWSQTKLQQELQQVWKINEHHTPILSGV